LGRGEVLIGQHGFSLISEEHGSRRARRGKGGKRLMEGEMFSWKACHRQR